jgi:hypothetical protein
VVLQTGGATPLYIASENGHVECMWALLDFGAAINQTTVGCAVWTAEYCEGCVCAGMSGMRRACMCSFVGCAGWIAVQLVGQ